MKTSKPLRSKTSLKSKSRLQANAPLPQAAKPIRRGGKGRGPLEKRTHGQLVNVADELWSRYIRLRDSERTASGDWYGACITCDKPLLVRTSDGKWAKGAECGHFITRGCHVLRYDERNTNLQCSHCNAWRDKHDMLARYTSALHAKFGPEIVTELIATYDASPSTRLGKQAMIAIITSTAASLHEVYGLPLSNSHKGAKEL